MIPLTINCTSAYHAAHGRLTLTVQVGLGQLDQLPASWDRALLCPWRWKILRLWYVQRSSPGDVRDVNPVGRENPPKDWMQDLTTALEEQLSQLRERELLLADDGGQVELEVEDQAAPGMPWHARLADVSTWPYPLPHELGVVTVSQPLGKQEVVFVAPEFEWQGIRFRPTEPLPQGDQVRWRYKVQSGEMGDPAVEVVAVSSPSNKGQEAVWCDLSGQQPATQRDWVSGLAGRVAGVTDVAALYLDVARNAGIDYEAGRPLLLMAAASLRDAFQAARPCSTEDATSLLHRLRTWAGGRADDGFPELCAALASERRGWELPEWLEMLEATAGVAGLCHALDTAGDSADRFREGLEALARAHTVLATDAGTRALLEREWTAAVPPGALRRRLEELFRAAPSDAPWRHACLLRVLSGGTPEAGDWWSAYVLQVKDEAEVRARLRDGLVHYARYRFQEPGGLECPWRPWELTPRLPHGVEPLPLEHGRLGLLLEELVCDRLAGLVLADSAPDTSPLMPDPIVVRGVRFAVDAPAADDADDRARHVRGVGAVIRRQPGGAGTGGAGKWTPWRCVTLAEPAVRKAGPPGEKTKWGRIDVPTVQPVQLAYHDGLLGGTVSYAGDWVTAESRLAEAFAGILGGEGDKPNGSLVRYLAPRPAQARLPDLQFGDSVQVAAFVVGDGGALPRQIAAKDHPAKIVQTMPELPQEARPVRFEYRRRVKVGPLRLSGRAGHAWPPRIPPDVELRWAEAEKGDKGDSVAEVMPVLLVGEDGRRVPRKIEVWIRPPAVDLAVWHRWVGRDRDRDRRRRGWRELHWRRWHEPDRDWSLDDPAVAALLVELTWTDEKGQDTTGAQTIRWRAGSVSLLAAEQREPILLKIEACEDRTGFDRFEDGTISVVVRTGDLLEVRLYPVIHATDFRERFDAKAYAATGGSKFVRTAPTVLRVEVATKTGLPDCEDVRKAMRVACESPPEGSGISRSLAVSIDVNANRARMVGAAEVAWQAWYWTGLGLGDASPMTRPTPYAAPDQSGWVKDDGSPTLAEWLFPGRSTAAANTAPMTLSKDGSDATWTSVLPLGDDRRARYLRYEVRLLHRYRGVWAPDGPPLSARGWIDQGLGVGSDAPWKGVVVKALRPAADEFKPPLIRAVLPLTRGGGTSPGLLVVVDGPWFDQFGLAECLEAEAQWLAPDPVRSKAKKHSGPVELTLTGPVGHSNDPTDLDASRLILGSSFILDVHADRMDWQAWPFVSVRFRRKLRKDLVEKAEQGDADVFSDWTPFLLAQLLPPALLPANDVRLRLQGIEGDWATTSEIPPATKSKGAGVGLFLVITDRIVDMFGRQGGEAYFGVYQHQGGVSWRRLTPSRGGGVVPSRPVARLMEVQFGPDGGDPGSEEALWGALFPETGPEPQPRFGASVDTTAERGRATILRISDPFTAAGG